MRKEKHELELGSPQCCTTLRASDCWNFGNVTHPNLVSTEDGWGRAVCGGGRESDNVLLCCSEAEATYLGRNRSEGKRILSFDILLSSPPCSPTR